MHLLTPSLTLCLVLSTLRTYCTSCSQTRGFSERVLALLGNLGRVLIKSVYVGMGGGGGGHGDAHYAGYPKGVWSPTGGWWCDPKLWRRNTAIALAGIFVTCIPIAVKSAQLEQRPVPPVRPIPSQMWCKNFGPPITQE